MARFYGIDEANQRLAELRPLLEELRDDRATIADAQAELQRARGGNGSSEHAHELLQQETRIRETVRRMQRTVAQLDGWDVSLRDIPSGLIDFPALANGRPIWLCWRLGEADIGWWHEIDVGFDERRPLADLT